MRKLILVFAAILATLHSGGAQASGNNVEINAARFVEVLGRDVQQILRGDDLSTQEREVKLRALLRDSFDFREIGRVVLGRYRAGATSVQLDEYQALFAEYLLGTYARLLQKSNVRELSVTAADRDENRDILISTRVEITFGVPIHWRWKVRETGSEFRVVDILSNGVSMAATYRSEFGSVIASRGIDALLKSLRARTSRSRASIEPKIEARPGAGSLASRSQVQALALMN